MKYVRTLILAAALVCGMFSAAPMDKAFAAGPPPVVIMETTMGRIIVMLSPKDAPKTVENFLKYVNAGFYDNTIFHRVKKEKEKRGRGDKPQENTSMSIVQGGGYTLPLTRKAPLFPSVVNEAATGLLNEKGTIAMARGNEADSANCQFFFNVKDNPVLDRREMFSQTGVKSFDSKTEAGYCAFGKVIRGLDVVERINEVKTVTKGGMEDVPAQPVILKKAYLAR